MRMIYISEGNLPSQAANSIHVAKMAQALSEKVDNFALVTIGDFVSFLRKNTFDFQNWYGLRRQFPIVRLPILLRGRYPFPPHYRNKRYLDWAVLYAVLRRPDLIYTRSVQGAKALLRKGLNVLLEAHGTNGYNFQAQVFRRSNFIGVVTISSLLANAYVKYGLERERILVEQDGVDIESFLPHESKIDARAKLGLPSNAFIVGYTGHLYDFKGLPTLFETASQLPEILFLIVGGWADDVIRARKYCETRGISNIWFVGHISQSHLRTYMYATDALVLPTSARHEWADTTSPLKLFEYMVVNRPIIASALPNIAVILKDMCNALLVKPDSVVCLMNAIKALREKPELCAKLAAQAVKDVKYYSWSQRVERILRFVRDRLDQQS